MALLNVVGMTDEQRAERREFNEACHRAVLAYVDNGMRTGDAFTRVATVMGVERGAVVGGYWAYVRAHAPDPHAPTRSRAQRRR